MKKLSLLFALTLIIGMASAQPPLRMKGLNPARDANTAPRTRIPGRSHWLLQFAHNPSAAELRTLQNRGVTVLSYIPDFAFSVSSQSAVSLEGLDIQRIHRLGPDEKISAALSGELAGQGSVFALIEFYSDVDGADRRAIAREAGLNILENSVLLPNHLLVRGNPRELLALADWDEVSYIFPASKDLVAGTPVYACPGADSSQGSVQQAIPLVGDGWDGPGLGSAALNYAFYNMTEQLPGSAVEAQIERAFSQWANYVQVTFNASDTPAANQTIGILFATGDHGDGYPFVGTTILAHTFYPFPVDPEPIAGDMHFNDAQTWQIGSGTDLFSVALHETGHALGLGHSDVPGDVMYPYYRMHTVLMPNDIAAAQDLYAAAASAPGPSPAPAPSPDPAPTSPLVIAVIAPPSTTTSASISLSGTASGGSGSVQVSWTTAAGATGVAQGSSSWFIPAIPLTAGANTINVTAEDSLGNLVTSSVTVTYQSTTPPPSDPNPPPAPPNPNPPSGPGTTPPSLTILSPSTTNYVTAASSLVVSGIATDNAGVTSVTWATSNGTTGTANGATNWSTPAIPLYVGATTIIITASDAAGNTTWRSLTVTRTQ